MHTLGALHILKTPLKKALYILKEPSKRALHHMHTLNALYTLKKPLKKALYILKRALKKSPTSYAHTKCPTHIEKPPQTSPVHSEKSP